MEKLAELVGVRAWQTVQQWENGSTAPSRKRLEKVAQVLGVSPEYLVAGSAAQASGFTPLRDKTPLVTIARYDTGGAMGHGAILRDQPGVIERLEVSHEWLEKNVRGFTSAKNLCVVTGFGDSMRPMYNPGDPLILDAGVKSVEFDAVYFFRVGDEGFIKRLQRIPGQGLTAISENAAYRDWVIDQTMDFEVFGRVLKVWRSEDF